MNLNETLSFIYSNTIITIHTHNNMMQPSCIAHCIQSEWYEKKPWTNFGMNQKIIMHFCVSLCLYNFKSCFRIFCLWADWIYILFNIYRQWNEYTAHRIDLLLHTRTGIVLWMHCMPKSCHICVLVTDFVYIHINLIIPSTLKWNIASFDSDITLLNSLKMQCNWCKKFFSINF